MTLTPTATRVLGALADETRQTILDALGEAPASASALARRLPISRQGTMKHLGVLEAAALVTAVQSGREMVYSIELAPMRAASDALARATAHWDRQLRLLKVLAEAPAVAAARAAEEARVAATDRAAEEDRAAEAPAAAAGPLSGPSAH